MRVLRGEIVKRLVVTVFGLPIVIGIVVTGSWIMGGALAILAARGTHELYRLDKVRRDFTLHGLGRQRQHGRHQAGLLRDHARAGGWVAQRQQPIRRRVHHSTQV